MFQRNSKLTIALVLFLFLAFGCAYVNYVGKSFDATPSVDVYFSKEEIKKEYVIIGYAIGSGKSFVSNKMIQATLVEKAKSKVADAILITGVGKSNVPVGNGSVDEKQINASFLKYK